VGVVSQVHTVIANQAIMDHLPELDEFEIISCLGYGARSTIYAVSEKKTGQVYALKRVIRKSSEDDRFLEQAEQEYAIASQFDHPALRKCVRMIRRRKLLKTTELFLLMELFDGTSLDVHRPDSLVKLIQIFIQVAQGLSAIHRLGYVHADIKPNNILVNEKLATKIIDFGQSCSIGTVKTRIQGTPDYIAPEQVGRGPLTPATDVFNFGATMYWCVTDHHIPTLIPKKKAENPTAPPPPRELKPPHEINPRIPMPLSRVIVDCVQNRPSYRPPDFTTVIPRLELALTVTKADSPLTRVRDLEPAIPESKDESKDDSLG
jgi:serine/threonine-protein kinase